MLQVKLGIFESIMYIPLQITQLLVYLNWSEFFSDDFRVSFGKGKEKILWIV